VAGENVSIGGNGEQDEIVIDAKTAVPATGGRVAVDGNIFAGDIRENSTDRGRPQEQDTEHFK
ncbi:hypothetical protein ACC754_43310, partial [Rhizobium johnstonii]